MKAIRINTVSEITTSEDKMVEQLNINNDYDVKVCGLTFRAGDIIKHLDPVALRCMCADEPIRYECDECERQYDDEDEALECCERWACPECKEEHDDKDDAARCCPYADAVETGRYYSNPSRESDSYALPDVEVWRTSRDEWWYWFCFPGCIPEGDAIGPFDSLEEARADFEDSE